MSQLLVILHNDILPVFVVIGLGYALGLRLRPNPQVLSRTTFYIFGPCLVFGSLATTELAGGEIVQIAVFTAAVALIMGLLGWAAARAIRLDLRATAGLVLTCMFVNSGNYGLGVVERAFGDEGLVRALIFFVSSTLLVYTFGVSIAAGSDASGWRSAVRRVFSVPPVYALIAAVAVRWLSVDLTHPALEPILAGIKIAGRAAIPVMLTILGMELSQTSVRSYLRPALAASGLRLVVAPLVAWGLAGVIGLTGVARQASMVEASMPAAVINIILATEYDAAPGLVTSTVLVSTLLSPFSLAVLIALVK